MSNLFETSGVHDDDAHWNARAEQVAALAMAAKSGRVAERKLPVAVWGIVSLAFAASLIFMLLSGRAEAPRADTALRIALAPADDVGRMIALTDAPPKIGDILLDSAKAEAAGSAP
jgi:hypothetical protein